MLLCCYLYFLYFPRKLTFYKKVPKDLVVSLLLAIFAYI